MKPDEFRDCIEVLGWSVRGLSTRLGLDESRIRRWASGRYPVPDALADWLRLLAAAHRLHPMPTIPGSRK